MGKHRKKTRLRGKNKMKLFPYTEQADGQLLADAQVMPSKDDYTKERRHNDPIAKSKALSGPVKVSTVTGGSKSTGKSVLGESCYMSHPELKFGLGTFIGGSCGHPKVHDADVYVGLQSNTMAVNGLWPWEPGYRPVIRFEYPITDYQAPSDSKSFIQMITWLCNQLQDGKRVHVGCIGGHGRTGTVLTAIVATFWQRRDEKGYEWVKELPDQKTLEERKFIQWVRAKYCTRAVESNSQIGFLMKHFDAKTASEGKSHYTTTSYKGGYGGKGSYASGANYSADFWEQQFGMGAEPKGKKGRSLDIKPFDGNKNIWRKKH